MSRTKVGLCVQCHRVISSDAPTCAHCGAEQSTVETVTKEGSSREAGVAVTAIGPQPQSRFCPKCGHALGDKAAFCSKCGAAQPHATVSGQSSGRRRPLALKLILGLSGLFGLLMLVELLAPQPKDNSSSDQAAPPAISAVQTADAQLGQDQPAESPQNAAAEPEAAAASIADQIKSSLSNSGSGFFSSQPHIQRDRIADFSFDADNDLSLTVNVGDWWSINAAGVRTHLSEPLATFRRVVDEFPRIERIRVSFVSTAAEERDQYGNVINSGSVAPFIELDIDCDDLRKFPKDFGWDSYPVYAAHRYLTMASPQIRDPWDTELLDEMNRGGFSEFPKRHASTYPDAR